MSNYRYKCWGTVLCCMFLVILHGCANAPEEVLDEINNVRNQQESPNESEQAEENIIYTKVSELRTSLSEYMTTSRGNLSFDGTIMVPDTDYLYDLRLEPCTSFYDNREKLIPDILAWYQIPYDDWNSDIVSWVDNESETYIGLRATENPNDYPVDFIILLVSDLQIGIEKDGSMALVNEWGINREYEGINHFWHEIVDIETYETWYLWNCEMPEVEIIFSEETVALQELYEDFSQVVDLYNSQNNSLGLQIYSATYFRTVDQDVCVQLEAVQTYRGVCFDPVEQLTAVVDVNGRSLLGERLKGKYHCREDRCLFGMYKSSYIPVEELAIYDEVISFDSALDLLSEKLGNYYIADIEEAALFYLRYYYGAYGVNWLSYEDTITAYSHPYWRFVERSDGNDSFERTVYYVDAITGEVLCFYENCSLY